MVTQLEATGLQIRVQTLSCRNGFASLMAELQTGTKMLGSNLKSSNGKNKAPRSTVRLETQHIRLVDQTGSRRCLLAAAP
ncbi:MAG: hypothetical protein ABJZ55_16025 [Fuerstiella sp.]